MPAVGAADCSARSALRAATEAAHLRLHAIPDFEALAEGRITRAGYVALLRRLLGFHVALEARLAEAPPLDRFGLDVAARRRAPLLRADLAWFGAAAEGPMAPLPCYATAAAALGALYVAEGSTLGGRHLARGLDALLLPGPEGRRFLMGHGARHGEMWRACCAAIELCGAEPGARAAMIRAALETFAAFEAWFASPSPASAGQGRCGGFHPIAPSGSTPLPP
ncbi:biliverdin-producing heme oxygenase [Falsiroseomonas oryzae]|uniref:biliverdin-producing heme oxygenase n=1 Tax=Falsiroseomonas oryzae TaxID=2766473 RepID=UPI0022EB99F1|nr:biliverdin-producing heme oxygenase [Roseomonas sp. MO-31]